MIHGGGVAAVGRGRGVRERGVQGGKVERILLARQEWSKNKPGVKFKSTEVCVVCACTCACVYVCSCLRAHTKRPCTQTRGQRIWYLCFQLPERKMLKLLSLVRKKVGLANGNLDGVTRQGLCAFVPRPA